MKIERRRDLERKKRKQLVVPPYWRPKTYGDCLTLPRPCPYMGCRYHLLLNVSSSGGIKISDTPIENAQDTCALDVAARGAHVNFPRHLARLLGTERCQWFRIITGALRKLRTGDALTPDDIKG